METSMSLAERRRKTDEQYRACQAQIKDRLGMRAKPRQPPQPPRLATLSVSGMSGYDSPRASTHGTTALEGNCHRETKEEPPLPPVSRLSEHENPTNENASKTELSTTLSKRASIIHGKQHSEPNKWQAQRRHMVYIFPMNDPRPI